MSSIHAAPERLPRVLYLLGSLAEQIGRLITISTTPLIAQHVLEQEGLEVQPGGDVEVGGDRLRVVVRDDGGEALFPQCEDALDAAIVEFDPLADPNGSAADDQDFSSSQSRRLAGRLVRRIEVGRPRLKFASARVDHLVRRTRSTPTDPLFGTSSERGEGLIREPGALRFGQ